MGSVIAPHDRGAAPARSSARARATADENANVFDGSAVAATEARHGGGALDSRPHRPTPILQPASVESGLIHLNRQLDGYAVTARTIAEFHAPVAAELARMQRIQHDLDRFIAPVRPVLEQTRWLAQQVAAVRRLAVPNVSVPYVSVPKGWWTDLWPTDGLMTSVLRPLDVLRPQLRDLSRTLDNLLSATKWVPLHADVWRDLLQVGRRFPYWAVADAAAAMRRGDFEELDEFISVWLDAEPTLPRREALVEVLLGLDLGQYDPDDGPELLTDLALRVRRVTRERRREHVPLLGFRRGTATIRPITHPEDTVLHRLGERGTPSLEDTVLDRLQPDGDPRVRELVNDLPPLDRKIALLKIVSGCSWPAAATQCGAPPARGETIRRRLVRRRDGLPESTDPWAEVRKARTDRHPRGVLRPGVVVLNGVTGIWP
jgi:hypothetical protein